MKKIKFALPVLTAVLAVCAAFATKNVAPKKIHAATTWFVLRDGATDESDPNNYAPVETPPSCPSQDHSLCAIEATMNVDTNRPVLNLDASGKRVIQGSDVAQVKRFN